MDAAKQKRQERILAGFVLGVAIVAFVLGHLPDHRYREANPFGWLCAAPDCHPDASLSDWKTCSFYAHSGIAWVCLFLVVVAQGALAFLPAMGGRWALAILVLLLTVVSAFAGAVGGMHLFEPSQPLPASSFTLGALVLLFVFGLAQLVGEIRAAVRASAKPAAEAASAAPESDRDGEEAAEPARSTTDRPLP